MVTLLLNGRFEQENCVDDIMRFQAFETFAERIGVVGKRVGARELITGLKLVGGGSRPCLRKRWVTRVVDSIDRFGMYAGFLLTRRSLTNEHLDGRRPAALRHR